MTIDSYPFGERSHTGEMILQAIKTQCRVAIEYYPGERIVEPHAYGLSAQGNELVRVFQVSGASRSGVHEGWKLIRVDRINSIQLLDQHFLQARPLYRQGDSHMKGGILAEL